MLAYDRFDSKKHTGIIAYFNQHYIKQGKIDRNYSKIIMSAEKIRINTDYLDFFVVSKDEAKKQIKDAEEFIRMIEDYIKESIL